MAARGSILVTGAYGLVGRPVVKRLVADGFTVIATAHRATKPSLPSEVEVRSVDLAKPDQIRSLLAEVSSSAIIHLAAVIPPLCYANRALARAVNVDATAALVAAAEAQPSPPRFVHASSMAVYGSRNPRRSAELMTVDTPLLASDLYSCHKILAENIVRSSELEWSILRLGGVITHEPLVDYGNFDAFYFGALLPDDNRCQTVDSRDVAAAFSAAVTTEAVREVFLIGGDESHRRLQGEVARANTDSMGVGALLFAGRNGNPDSDGDWYPLHWMDTARSQQVLSFQRHSFSEAYDEIRIRAGWKRRPLRMAAPALAPLVRRRGPYYKQPGQYADPWDRIRDKWGDPGPDAEAPLGPAAGHIGG